MATITSDVNGSNQNSVQWGSVLGGLGLLSVTLYALLLGFRFLQTPETYLTAIDPL